MRVRINARKAIKRLGIREPVTFRAVDLSGVARAQGIPEGEAVAGVHHLEPNTVQIDVGALHRAIHEDGSDPRFIIAHELVHVAQLQEAANPFVAALEYMRETHGSARAYKESQFERQADELGEWIKELVEVTVES